jgi:hypothetical protein
MKGGGGFIDNVRLYDCNAGTAPSCEPYFNRLQITP